MALALPWGMMTSPSTSKTAAPLARSRAVVLALGLGAWLTSSPVEAASLKLIQTGDVSMSSSPVTVNSSSAQPFNGVTDLSKAFVVCASRTNTANPADRVTCELSAGAITITAGAANANTVVRWHVVEFEGGVVVQRGVRTFSTAGGGVPSDTTLNVTLNPAVDLAKSFVLISERMNSTVTDDDESWTVRAQLTADNNLELTRTELAAATSVAWQVVQMEGASVQRGLTSLQAGSTTAGWSIAGATMTNSFLVFSRRGANLTSGVENRYLVTGEITDLSTLTFTRGSTEGQGNKAALIAWEVVTLNDGSATNRGAALIGATTQTMDRTLTPTVDISRTLPFVASRVVFGGDANLGSASLTARITASDTLRVERGPTTGLGHNYTWQTVEFFKCAAVPDVGYVAATAGSGGVTVYWSSPDPVLIVRDGAAIPDRPDNGKAYAIDDPVGSGSARVKYDGAAAASWTDTSVTAGSTYYYRVFPKTGAGGSSCYAPGTDAQVDTVLPAAAPPTWTWSYTLAGGSMLRPGIAGWDGTVSPSSNAERLISLNTSTGAQNWTVDTTGAAQGWLSWIPISGSADAAVIAGDQGGTVYSINPATGASNWATPKALAGLGADAIQAPVAAQLRAYSNGLFTHTTDVLFAATLNSTTTVPCGTASTNNKLFALNASTGDVLWTFNNTAGPNCTHEMNYVSGMPYVDYGRNRVYVTSHSDDATKTQPSLWVIDSVTGALVPGGSLALGHLDSSPTLSYDGGTIYVGNTDGMLYAINATTLAQRWSLDLGAGAAVKGFVWQDWVNPRRLYFSTTNDLVWCVEDKDTFAEECPAPWAKPTVPGPSTPLPLSALYVGSGAPDFKLYQINLTTGAIEKSLALDGTKVGDVSTEWNPVTGDYNWVFVGTGAGRLYRIEVPLP